MKQSFGNSKAGFKNAPDRKQAMSSQDIRKEGDATILGFGTSLATGWAACSPLREKTVAVRKS
jgi:hypothetical protein